ncbi:MAG: metalloprotease, partial [Halobacteriaceae archaeon]
AGPVTNLLLAVVFVPVWFVFPDFGGKGVGINIILAGFNMLPFGGLDGQTVLSWNKGIYVAIFIPALIGSIGIIFFGIGL